MRRRAAPVLAVVAFLAAAGGAPPARAANPPRPPLGVPAYVSQTVSGAHFVVHYTSDQSRAGAWISTADANQLLANAESAYSWEVNAWGYPPPLNDGDGKTDVYVFDLPGGLGPAAAPDSSSADQTTGFILVDPADATNAYAVAHEFFHLVQFAIYGHGGFVVEPTAEWMGANVRVQQGGLALPNWYPSPQVSLDCMGSACADHDSGAYRGSIFFEYLSERFGMGLVHELFAREAVLGAADHAQHAMQALGDVLAAHGSSIADAFDGYALAAVAGTITRPGVLPRVPAEDHAMLADVPGSYPVDPVTVDHLALKRITYYGAMPSVRASTCQAAALSFTVELPGGVPTQPVFVAYPASGAPPATAVYPLAVGGGVATATVPWSTCSGTIGTLVLPNASTSSDGGAFAVHATVVAASQPPPPPPPPAPSNSFKLTTTVGTGGLVSVRVTTLAPGRVSVRASTAVRSGRRTRTVSYGSAAGDTRANAVTLGIRPSPSALRLLTQKRTLSLTVTVSFAPRGGTAASRTVRLTVRYRAAVGKRRR